MEPEWVKAFFNSDVVVEHYLRATANVGLWLSEEILLRELFALDDRILDLGTGTGRIAIGMAELGYRHILGIEQAPEMIKEARRIAKCLDLAVSFRVGDARNLKLDDGLFDGAIFGFNGLMQIPGRENRRAALREALRVVRPGGKLLFTTHDRNLPRYRKYWRQQQDLWQAGMQPEALIDFGDRWEETDLGLMFIHIPVPEEIRADLAATGWEYGWDRLRSSVADESQRTRRFADECRFWMATRP